MLTCCGKNVRTRFCPECGKPVAAGSVWGRLLAYLEHAQKSVEKTYAKHLECRTQFGPAGFGSDRHGERLRNEINSLAEWRQAVQEVIETEWVDRTDVD